MNCKKTGINQFRHAGPRGPSPHPDTDQVRHELSHRVAYLVFVRLSQLDPMAGQYSYVQDFTASDSLNGVRTVVSVVVQVLIHTVVSDERQGGWT
jgi:hypothetical protein